MQAGERPIRWLIAAGILLTVVWETTVSGIPVGDRVLHPGVLAYCVLMLVTWRTIAAPAGSIWRPAWFGCSAVALADLPIMATRASQAAQPPRDLAAGALLAAAILLPLARWSRGRRRLSPVTRSEVLISWAAAMATIAGYQGFNLLARAAGVPNEERSVIVGGIEWHHVNWGILLLPVAVVAASSLEVPGPKRLALALVTGLGVGMVLDQWYYYMGEQVTDESYFEPATWGSALALGVVLLGVWLGGMDRSGTPPERVPGRAAAG